MIENNGFNALLRDITTQTEIKADPAPFQPPLPDVKPIADTKEPSEPETPQMTEESLKSTTGMAMAMIDLGQETLFRHLTNKKVKKRAIELCGRDGETKLESALAKKEVGDGLTDSEMAVLHVHKKAQEIIKNLPFTESEKEILHEPLKEWLRTHGGEIPKEFWLMVACFQIFGGRFMNTYQL